MLTGMMPSTENQSLCRRMDERSHDRVVRIGTPTADVIQSSGNDLPTGG